MGVATHLRSRARVLPHRFWLLAGGTFIYLVGIEIGYPFETIYMNRSLGISMGAVGLIMGLSLLAGLPLQILGGAAADRFGRRGVLILASCGSITLYLGFAFAHEVWQLVAVIAFEAAFGWAMFLTANNAIIADLTPQRHRSEAFSISRVAINGGIIVGPLLGGVLLRAGAPFRVLFFIAACVCAIFLLLVLVRFRETKPGLAEGQGAGLSAFAGYRVVLRDRRFLAFCAVALLPLY